MRLALMWVAETQPRLAFVCEGGGGTDGGGHIGAEETQEGHAAGVEI